MRAGRSLVPVALLAAHARADELATSPTRPDYEATEKLLMWKGRKALEDRGLTIDGTYSSEVFFGPQLDTKLVLGGLFTMEVDVELDKVVDSHLGSIHFQGFAIHGRGLTDELMDVHGTSNTVAPEDVRLFEAWLDQPIYGPLILRAGLIAADQEFVISDESQTLLSATFGITGQFSANVLGPVYPIAAPGASLRYDLEKQLVARVAVYSGGLANTHGIPDELGPGYLVMGEVEVLDRFEIGGWHHPDLGEGGYAIVNAERLDEHLGAFARAGYSNQGPVSTYIDAGLRGKPGEWRPDDLFSIGIAYSRVEATGSQTLVEATYEAQVEWLTIQPDVQLLLLPERTVVTFATRLTLTL